MANSVKKLQDIHLHQTSELRIFIWRMRILLKKLTGIDLLDTTNKPDSARAKLRNKYRALDDKFTQKLPKLTRNTPRNVGLERIRDVLEVELGYKFSEVDAKRPWGGFFRITDEQIDKFLADFFPGLTKDEARLGHKDTELSPKIMVWLPGKRISWQYHARRAERWNYLTAGTFYRSNGDILPEPTMAQPGQVVQFACGERHRGGAPENSYALVAEIWQHTDPKHPSNESDITRLADDFNRPKQPKPF